MTEPDDVTTLALIGLGAMGEPLARRLAGVPGVSLTVFDVSEERLAAVDGIARRAASVADAARGADAVLTVLPADRHVEAVAAEIEAVATPGQVFVDLSTIGPATIERVAARLARAGVITVSVAITRGTAAARRGELALFVGVDGELPAVIRPALDALASELLVVPGLAGAKALKIANNALLACLDIAICEALVLGRRFGLAFEAVTDRLPEVGGESWALSNHVIRHVLTDDLGPGHFSTVNMAKDVELFLDLAQSGRVPAPFAGVAAACYRGVIAAGLGEHYHPIVIRWLEQGAWMPRATEAAPPRALDTIAAGVVAVQALVTREALIVLDRTGIAPAEGAGHLARGSAANASLEGVAGALDGGDWAAPVPGSLADALALAKATAVPAMMLEAGRVATACVPLYTT